MAAALDLYAWRALHLHCCPTCSASLCLHNVCPPCAHALLAACPTELRLRALPLLCAAQVKCLFADSPAVRRAANLSLLAVPFKPFAVSAGNALVMQAEFARQATHSKVGCLHVRGLHREE